MLFRQELESHSSDRPTRTTSRPSEFDDELRAILCEAYFRRAGEALRARVRLQPLGRDPGADLRDRLRPAGAGRRCAGSVPALAPDSSDLLIEFPQGVGLPPRFVAEP